MGSALFCLCRLIVSCLPDHSAWRFYFCVCLSPHVRIINSDLGYTAAADDDDDFSQQQQQQQQLLHVTSIIR